jgi:hypothetical protein
MGTGTSNRPTKAVKLARCSICRKVPASDCDWNQGRCPHREPVFVGIAMRNFFNFFKRSK